MGSPMIWVIPPPPPPPPQYLKLLPMGGLNELGVFSYDHYGRLLTPLAPAHGQFMLDTGIVGLDCEMVGVGPDNRNALGRVSIVNEYGYCLYDTFVQPAESVTDYRTQFSGIREKDLINATPASIAVKDVENLIKGHILVGHDLINDMDVLGLQHPVGNIRDTAFFFQWIYRLGNKPGLKTLVKRFYQVDIQEGEHSSIMDSQSAMALYQLFRCDWEASLRQVRQKQMGIHWA